LFGLQRGPRRARRKTFLVRQRRAGPVLQPPRDRRIGLARSHRRANRGLARRGKAAISDARARAWARRAGSRRVRQQRLRSNRRLRLVGPTCPRIRASLGRRRSLVAKRGLFRIRNCARIRIRTRIRILGFPWSGLLGEPIAPWRSRSGAWRGLTRRSRGSAQVGRRTQVRRQPATDTACRWRGLRRGRLRRRRCRLQWRIAQERRPRTPVRSTYRRRSRVGSRPRTARRRRNRWGARPRRPVPAATWRRAF
jgi:hypothetical protein